MIMLLFVSIAVVAQSGGTNVHQTKSYTLYPPENFQGQLIEWSAYLTWNKPHDLLGNVPPGLIGYKIYRNSVLLANINNPDSLFHYDMNLYPGTYSYSITAWYDLTSYGFPGYFEESDSAGPVLINITSPLILPFYEPWDMGTFSFNYWNFEPGQGNWIIDIFSGNPAPTSKFEGLPALAGYSYKFFTMPFSIPQIPCESLFLEFDYRLTDIASGNTEKLSAVLDSAGVEAEIESFTNNGASEWHHVKHTITEFNNDFNIGFRASGQLSSNITSWEVDNIHLYGICHGPDTLILTRVVDTVFLDWTYPCGSMDSLTGFNVYRSQLNGNLPFYKLNPTPVTNTHYKDVYPSGTANDSVRYFVTGLFSYNNMLFCEAGSDTVYVNMALGTKEKPKSNISVSPIPADNILKIRSSDPVEECRLINLNGSEMVSIKPTENSFEIPVVSLPAGFYFLRIRSGDEIIIRKVTIIH